MTTAPPFSVMDRAPLNGVSVIVPALNEQQGIGPTLEAVALALTAIDLPSEIVVVDDGSSDATADLARAAGAIVVAHPVPGGYGHALRAGIRAARYEAIVTTDADGSYPVDEIPHLVAQLSRFDMVVGARTGPVYMRRAILSPVRSSFLMLARFVTGKWLPDPNSGLRAFRRSDVLPILNRLPRGFSFTTTLTLIMTLEGRFIHYHKIDYRQRIGRSKVRVVRDALRVGQGLVEVMLLYNPLKVFLAAAVPPTAAAIGVLARSTSPAALLAAAILAATGWLAIIAGMLAVVVRGEHLPR
jgi:glycosyltransferase involved in cell wall biosynthesis